VPEYREGTVDFTRVALIDLDMVPHPGHARPGTRGDCGDVSGAGRSRCRSPRRGEIALGQGQVYLSLGGGWQLRFNGCELPASPPPRIPPPAETASPFADFKPAETPPSLPSVEQPAPPARPLVPDAASSSKPLRSRPD
jgi:hypothetical protein